MEKFNKIYSDICRINKTDPASPEARLGKLAEEFGEIAKAVNKTNGRKVLKPEDTPKAIRAEILDEAADTIQNVISLVDSFGIKAPEVLDAMIRKNNKWKEKIAKGKRGPGSPALKSKVADKKPKVVKKKK